MHKTSNSHKSLISQRKSVIQLADFSTLKDLQEASIDFMNCQTRKLTFNDVQKRNRCFLAMKMQNRSSTTLVLCFGQML